MSNNPFMRRILGEDAPPAVADPDPAVEPAPVAPGEVAAARQSTVPVTDLLQLWQGGEHMAVATELMFTPASYVDFVDLCFQLGQEEARKLGALLDELADSENLPVPAAPSNYASILQNVYKQGRDRRVLPPEM